MRRCLQTIFNLVVNNYKPHEAFGPVRNIGASGSTRRDRDLCASSGKRAPWIDGVYSNISCLASVIITLAFTALFANAVIKLFLPECVVKCG